MFNQTRWNPFEDLFSFQREVDRLFNQFWSNLPARTASASSSSFHVDATDEGWRVNIPMPGIDPADVTLEATGHSLAIHAKNNRQDGDRYRFEQTFSLPEFLDLDQLRASHRHGMLQLAIPFKESVKPRRIAIDTGSTGEPKQLDAAA